ncbi:MULTISPECIES: sugar ABC transporter permease [Clostridia]|uniref:ABC transporter permease n=1 Tax=Clostridia TaxID=186801 RepID=UPI0012B1C4FA|nr:ABC transporter permease subunit [Clostridium sp. WB02_MRS01]MBW4845021.1 ABC transporter permease subunit [Lachnospiraceae bacterium]MSS08194.1 sugar ABC transporter permease [Clostridium sp. WB02_MRS01]
MAKRKAGGAQSKLKRIWRDRVLYLTLLPTLLYFFVFHVIPIIGMKLAFYDYRIKGDNVFVGFTYFIKLFSTPVFLQILENTLIISAMKIFLFFPMPIIFAIMLNEFKAGPFRKSVQVISYLPHFLSWVVIAGIWFEFLSPSTGILNSVLSNLGFGKVNLLTSKGSIRWVLLASESWRSIGWDSIVYLTAIMGIDPTLYEAAKIDGANRFQIVGNIVLPALAVTMVTVLILNIGFFMNAGLDQVLNFTNAAVNSKIDIIDTYVYRIGLQNSQYSLATAANLFKGVIGTLLIVSTHLFSKKLTGKGAW